MQNRGLSCSFAPHLPLTVDIVAVTYCRVLFRLLSTVTLQYSVVSTFTKSSVFPIDTVPPGHYRRLQHFRCTRSSINRWKSIVLTLKCDVQKKCGMFHYKEKTFFEPPFSAVFRMNLKTWELCNLVILFQHPVLLTLLPFTHYFKLMLKTYTKKKKKSQTKQKQTQHKI